MRRSVWNGVLHILVACRKSSRWGLLYLLAIIIGLGVIYEFFFLAMAAVVDVPSSVILSLLLVPAYVLWLFL